MWKVMYRSVLAHKGRLIRTAVAVLIGVSFISGTYVLTDTLKGVFDEITATSTEGVDLYVRGQTTFNKEFSWETDRPPVPEALVDDIRSIEGVERAAGSIAGNAVIFDDAGEPIKNGFAPNFGMSWASEPVSTVAQLTDGAAPEHPRDVVVDEATAEKNDIAVGDEVEIATTGPAHAFRVSGIVRFGSEGNLAGATMVLFETETAQEEFRRTNEFDAIEIATAPGIDPNEIMARIDPLLTSDLEVVEGAAIEEESNDQIGNFIGLLNTALMVFAVISLFVGAFIIFNTFSIIVAQRTREFALLRALGASPAQVTWSVLIEAAVVGLVASGLGMLAGIGIAAGIRALLDTFGMEVPGGSLRFLPRTAIVAGSLGILVTMASALGPARRASRVPPLAAIRDVETHSVRSVMLRSLSGGALLVGGLTLLLAALFTDLSDPLPYVGIGALGIFLGVAALSVFITKPLAGLIGRPVARFVQVTGHLARQNSLREARRTATTASALMIGVALVSFVAIFSASIKASATSGLQESVKADFVITGGEIGMGVPFSPRVGERLSEAPEVHVASPVRMNEFQFEGSTHAVTAVNPATISEVVDLDVSSGQLSHLLGGGVAISDKVAENEQLEVGDRVDLRFASSGSEISTVDAIFDNGAAVQSDYVISTDLYERSFTQQQDVMVFVAAAPGVGVPELRAAVDEAVEGFPSIEVMTAAEMRDSQSAQIDQMLGMITALLGLAIVIAVIGIGNTLALSILERTREIGLMRAVGMSRHQVRSLVRWEAVIIALFGATLGLVVGVFFGWAVTTALGSEGIEELRFPVAQLGIYLLIAALAGVLAALGPARRAARLDVLGAIATE